MIISREQYEACKKHLKAQQIASADLAKEATDLLAEYDMTLDGNEEIRSGKHFVPMETELFSIFVRTYENQSFACDSADKLKTEVSCEFKRPIFSIVKLTDHASTCRSRGHGSPFRRPWSTCSG